MKDISHDKDDLNEVIAGFHKEYLERFSEKERTQIINSFVDEEINLINDRLKSVENLVNFIRNKNINSLNI